MELILLHSVFFSRSLSEIIVNVLTDNYEMFN